MQTGLEKDIVFLVANCSVGNYMELCEMLRAYGTKAVLDCANSLVKQGVIRLGAQGFEHCEKQGKESGTETLIQKPQEESAGERNAQKSQGTACLTTPPKSESSAAPSPEKRNDAGNRSEAVAKTALKPAAAPEIASVAVKEATPGAKPREAWFRKLASASKGSLLASSSIKLLGLPDYLAQSFVDSGVSTIADVVRRIDTLGKSMPTDSAVAVFQALLRHCADPLKFGADDDTKRQLHGISGSSSFSFDWLGVLTTTVPRNATTTFLSAAVAKRGSDLPDKKEHALEVLAASYDSDVKTTVVRLENHLKSKGYPVFEDSFEAIMLPIVFEGFKYGEYENQNEALAECGKLVDNSPQTKEACFGMLRDRILEQREKGTESSFIGVRWADAFIDAAKRIAALDCGCSFDAANKRLNIL